MKGLRKVCPCPYQVIAGQGLAYSFLCTRLLWLAEGVVSSGQADSDHSSEHRLPSPCSQNPRTAIFIL